MISTHSLLSWSQTRNQFTTRSVKTYSNVSLEGFKTSAKILNKTRLNDFFRQKVFSDCFHCIGHKNQCFKCVSFLTDLFQDLLPPHLQTLINCQELFKWFSDDINQTGLFTAILASQYMSLAVYYRPLVHFAHLLWVYSAFTLTEPAEFSALKVPGLRKKR